MPELGPNDYLVVIDQIRGELFHDRAESEAYANRMQAEGHSVIRNYPGSYWRSDTCKAVTKNEDRKRERRSGRGTWK